MSDRWKAVDQAAGHWVTAPHECNPVALPTSALPQQLHPIPGLVSYHLSTYPSLVVVASSVSVIAQAIVGREDGDLLKNYKFAYGSSSDGRIGFAALEKHFPGHYVPLTATSSFAVSSLFGGLTFHTK